MDNRPIGVFDSGLGGLTGVRELRKRLPHEEIIYFGDTGRVPYGSRSPETILQYARQDIAFLLSKDVKCIMAACGTVSSTYPAAEAETLPVPYLGVVDAAAREAAFSTRNRRIGVIGTAATIRSRSYEALLRRLVPGVEITARPCPLFVPLVEAGYVDHSAPDKQEITKLVIAQYLTEIRDAGVDTLILGCTHYPLIKTMIGEFMGRNVVVVDPAMADDGKLYPVFTPDIVKEMKKLISAATVVTPNYTEACLLTDRPYDDKPVTTDALLSIAHDLTARGPKQVVITSVPSDKGTIRIACFDAKEGTYSDYKVKRIPFATCGTGDLFTSVVTGSLLQGKSLSDAVKKAASFLSYAIEYTYKDGSDYREGVQVEPCLAKLLEN